MNKKFIVYLTVNTKNQKIYVGVHKTEDPNVFDGYIGCGVWKHDKVRLDNPTTYFQRAVKKYGADSFNRLTLAIFDSADEAYSLEAHIVTRKFLSLKNTYNVALGGINTNKPSKTILQYSKEGYFIKKWDSSQSAASTLKTSTSNIRSVCLGTNLTAAGYQWRYEDFELGEIFNKIPSVLNRTGSTRLAQYKLDGSLITIWKSANVAGKEFGTKGEVLVRNAIFGKQWKSYQWRVLTEDKAMPLIDEFISTKAIVQLDEKNEIVRVWSSKADARKAGFNNVTRAVNKNKMAGGFYWKKLIDYKIEKDDI